MRVTERYLYSDPPTDAETERARAAIQAALQSFPASDAVPFVAGLGGTAVNVASVTNPNATLHGVTVTRADVQNALQMFVSVPVAERKQIVGLEPARADVIVGGTLVLDELLAHFRAEQFTVSVRGLRFGLLAEAARQKAFPATQM